MNWIKKNLLLLAGVLVALGLLGVAGWFWFTNKAAVAAVSAELNAKTQEFQTLMTRDPHPNQENIEAAKKEQQRVAALLEQTRKNFLPAASFPTNLDKETFKGLLETTIFEIGRNAERAGVSLPNSNKYDFTFKPQRGSVVFAPETLVPLANQVAEIKAICDALFQARVHSLISLRRIPVAKEDEGPTDFLVGKKPVTNTVTGAVSTPYEIVFQGFTTELAGVLEAFIRAPNCFIVKNLDVQTNLVAAAAEGGPVYYPTYTFPTEVTPQISPEEMMRRRYGLSGRYARRPTDGPMPYTPPPVASAPAVATTPVRRGPETVLDERSLKITMYIESVRLPEAPAKLKAAN